MKTKIIEAIFDKNTGYSTVKIQTPKGIFCGQSLLRGEDVPFASKIAGLRYAEIKANIAAIKNDIKENKIRLYSFQGFLNTLKTSKRFNSNSYEAIRLKKEIEMLKKKIKQQEETKEKMKNNLLQAINLRDKTVREVYQKISDMKKNQKKVKNS